MRPWQPLLPRPHPNDIVVVMIPTLVHVAGALDKLLPPGIYPTTMAEVAAEFARTQHRAWLFEGIVSVVRALKIGGSRRLYLDGSFVSDKRNPGDFDGCWDPIGVDSQLLDPILLDFDDDCAAQKQKYRGQLFPSTSNSGLGGTHLEAMQIDKYSGKPKGILSINLKTETFVQ